MAKGRRLDGPKMSGSLLQSLFAAPRSRCGTFSATRARAALLTSSPWDSPIYGQVEPLIPRLNHDRSDDARLSGSHVRREDPIEPEWHPWQLQEAWAPEPPAMAAKLKQLRSKLRGVGVNDPVIQPAGDPNGPDLYC